MLDFIKQLFDNKLLFFGIIILIGFIILTIILIKRANKEETETSVDFEKIDGEHSLFDEMASDESLKMSDGKLDLESMIEKMQKDLDAKASDVVTKFENEQEEKSIISYQELLHKDETPNEQNNKIYLNDVLDKMDGATNSDSHMDTNTRFKETYVNALELEEKNLLDSQSVADEIGQLVNSNLNKKDEYVQALKTGEIEEKPSTKFKSTDFISPIYGIQDIKVQYPTVQNIKNFRDNNYKNMDFDRAFNVIPLDEELKKDEDFLNSLKEFRKNLD